MRGLVLLVAVCAAHSLKMDIQYPHSKKQFSAAEPKLKKTIAHRETFVPYSQLPEELGGQIGGEEERGVIFLEDIYVIDDADHKNSKVVIVHAFKDGVFRPAGEARRPEKDTNADWLAWRHTHGGGPTRQQSLSGVGCVSAIANGFRWKNAQLQQFVLDPSGAETTAGTMLPQIQSAFQNWDQLLLEHQVWGGISSVSALDLSELLTDGPMGFNSISFRDIETVFPETLSSSGAVPLAFALLYGPWQSSVPLEDRQIIETHIVFDDQRVWQYDRLAPQSCSYFDWYRVLLHEIGHVYGLADTFGPGSCQPHIVMWFQVSPCSDKQLQSVTSGDECALRTLYSESPCLLGNDGLLTNVPPPTSDSVETDSHLFRRICFSIVVGVFSIALP